MPRIAESRRLKPSFIVIGAQRSGTTSLYNYLAEHPQVMPGATKEVHFFDIHFRQGADWYWRQFPPRDDAGLPQMITGEASPYYIFHPLAAERIAALLPETKLIALLRNPVDRAFSHHQHETRRGKETLPFAAALGAEEERLAGEREKILHDPQYRSTAHQWHSYRSRGCYMDQLENWLRFFPRERMLILLSERFYENPSTMLRVVTDFLALPPLPARNADSYEKHNLAAYSGMDPKMRKELSDFYRPHNQRLASFLGIDLRWDR